jgi:hypothetical protein
VLLSSKGYKHIDPDARLGWDRELKERMKGHRCDCGGDDNGQNWTRVMSELVSLGRVTVKDTF